VILAIRKGSPPARGRVIRALSTWYSMALAMALRRAMSLMENWTIPSRTPLRMAFTTTFWICSSVPSSTKILGAWAGSICQRTAASIFMLICSLESASIVSAPLCSSGHCSSRVLYRSTEDQGSTKRTPL
jgi:hypothetical protein